MRTTKSKRPFTLLEIALCIALLGFVASAIAMPLRSMVKTHTLNKSLATLSTSLRKAQSIALYKECDLTLTLHTTPEGLAYAFSCDDPPFPFSPKSGTLKGLTRAGSKPSLTLTIYSNGRILPTTKIPLYAGIDSTPIAHLNLSQPLLIILRRN